MALLSFKIGGGFITEAQPAGQYSKQFNLKAEPDPNCDPSQGPCEQWLPGNYNVKICKKNTSFVLDLNSVCHR